MKIGWNWLKLVKIARRWNFVAVLLAGKFGGKIYGWNIFKIKKKIEQNWVKLNEIGWNWVKLRVAIFAIFLTFVISCNFRQFWPIFVAVSGDLIGHFLYTSNLRRTHQLNMCHFRRKLVKLRRTPHLKMESVRLRSHTRFARATMAGLPGSNGPATLYLSGFFRDFRG